MSFSLPELPYAHDALAPYMSKETLEYHHDKHHLAYVNNGNNLLKGTEWEGKSLEEIVRGSYGKNPGLFNNAGQHYNHLHFWKWMKPNGGGKIPGELEKALIDSFGSVDKAKEEFIQAATTQFGSGWGWLAVTDGKIVATKTANGENPLVHSGHADPRRRRLGAFLLHRLPQPPARLSQGVRRQSRQLGICGGTLPRREPLRPRAGGASRVPPLADRLIRSASPSPRDRRSIDEVDRLVLAQVDAVASVDEPSA